MFQKLGKFEIKRLLGQGSMGEVYLGVDSSIGREVAVKTILASSPAGMEAKERFAREAKAAGLLNHPNLVTIHEFGEEQGVMYIAMEYVKGHDLEDLMRDRAMSHMEALEVLAQVCDGLGFAHRNHIVHRDIKPANVRVFRDGKRLHVKVMDFGVARLNNSEMTATGMVMGTVSYMAPEYIRNGIPDPRSDLFAIGVILYEMLSGRKPFSGGTTATILYKIVNEAPEPIDLSQLQDISPSIRSVLDRALCKDPTLRYQTAEELAQALRTAKDPTWTGATYGETVQLGASNPGLTLPTAAGLPPPIPLAAPAQAPRSSALAITALAVSSLAILLGLGGFGYWRWRQGQEPAAAAAIPIAPASAGESVSPTSQGPAVAAPPRLGGGAGLVQTGQHLPPNTSPTPVPVQGTRPPELPKDAPPPKGAMVDSKPSPSVELPPPKPQVDRSEPMSEAATRNLQVWTVNRVYKSADDIVVVYKNLPENRYVWIDISKADGKDGSYRQYYWTHGKSSGEMNFAGLGLDPGTYEVRVHFSRAHSVDQRFQFRVE